MYINKMYDMGVAHGTGGGEERRDAYMVLLEKSEGKKIEN
jgi:hypothetical protein